MSIVLGIITFAVFYADMIWMNCIYPEMYKGKKAQEEIEAKSKNSSLICIIILIIIFTIAHFIEVSPLLMLAVIATLFMCIIKCLPLTNMYKAFVKELENIHLVDYEESFSDEDYDEYCVPGSIFEEYDDEDEVSAFKEYNGKGEENHVELTDENDIDEDEIIDIIDGKIYI